MNFAHFKRVDVFVCVKVVQFKQQSRLEEKRKKALDLQLDFIVGQTEKYSDLLSKSLAPARPLETAVSPQKSLPPPVDEDGKKKILNYVSIYKWFFLSTRWSAFRPDSMDQTAVIPAHQ